MDENTIKIINDRLASLPQSLREMFMSAYYENTLEEIGNTYQLDLDQVNFLQKETSLVIMGINKPEDFESELKKELIIDAEKISQISREVNVKIFSKVMEFLEMVNSPSYESEEETGKETIETKPQPDIVQKLDPRFDKLPDNIQNVVEKSDYQTILYGIAQAHKLSITQMGTLDAVTTDLMVGTIHPDEFKGALLKSLSLSEEETTSLVNEINEKVFKKIRSQMMGINNPKPKAPEIQPLKSDLETLKSHGIEIVPETLEIEAPHPILQQKLSAPVQATSVKTDYTIKPKDTPKPATYKPGEDPYRVVPE